MLKRKTAYPFIVATCAMVAFGVGVSVPLNHMLIEPMSTKEAPIVTTSYEVTCFSGGVEILTGVSSRRPTGSESFSWSDGGIVHAVSVDCFYKSVSHAQ